MEAIAKPSDSLRADPDLVPDLAVEVLNAGNTEAGMQRTRRDCFAAEVRLVGELDPDAKSMAVDSSPSGHGVMTQDEMLTGGDVLPGLSIRVGDFFRVVQA